MRPAEAIITQNIVHNHTKKGAKAVNRDLVGHDYDPINTFQDDNVGGSGIPGPPDKKDQEDVWRIQELGQPAGQHHHC